jgi:hypothetical protein
MDERRPKSDCIEHTIDINNLKKDMESVRNHEAKFNRTIEKVLESVESTNISVLNINNALEHFKDLPGRVRKLEDKSIVYDLIKLGLGLLFGFLIKDYYDKRIAVKEENNYTPQTEQSFSHK